MDLTSQTNCPFHLQDDPDDCGPAVCMMVLATLNIPYSELDQCGLFEKIQTYNHSAPNSGWLSDPYGIEGVLNEFTPSTWKGYLQPDILEATRDIIYAIRQHAQPPVVLTLGGGHWEVIEAVATDIDPTLGDFHVDIMWIHNPSLDGRQPVNPHGPSDACGKPPYAPDKKSWYEWENEVFLADSDDVWGGVSRFVSICDPDNRDGFGHVVRPLVSVADDVDNGDAIRLAQEYFDKFGVGPYPEAQKYVAGAGAVDALRVTRLFREGREGFYYLVPFEKGGEVVTTIKLDRGGRFRSLRVHQGEFSPIEDFIRRFVSRADRTKRMGFVWRPCLESRSPHMPFYADVHGGRLVRLDSRDFATFTDLGKGA
jgi:hypothetical protein